MQNYANEHVRSSYQQQQQQPSQHKQQQFSCKKYASDSNKTSGQSVQARNVNSSSNATGDMFPAFTTVLQFMAEISGAATEKERFLS
jgi:hypothetical protein